MGQDGVLLNSYVCVRSSVPYVYHVEDETFCNLITTEAQLIDPGVWRVVFTGRHKPIPGGLPMKTTRQTPCP